VEFTSPIPFVACYYCGDPADTIDHVVPRSLLRRLRDLDDPEVTALMVHRNRIMEVDCCRDCNSRLGSSYSRNLQERRNLLRARLRRRFKTLLSIPDWSDAELGRLGPSLQQTVIARLVLRDRIRKRLIYEAPAKRPRRLAGITEARYTGGSANPTFVSQ